MQGNKANLFCLHLSFVGWQILMTIATLVPTMIACGASAILNGFDGLFMPTKLVALVVVVVLTYVGSFFIDTYKNVSEAIFYMSISGQEYGKPDIVE